jgi:hypothetical protein
MNHTIFQLFVLFPQLIHFFVIVAALCALLAGDGKC